MNDKKQKSKRHLGGRPPIDDPAIHRYSFKLNSTEKLRFEQMFEDSGIWARAKFIKAVLFGREIKVVKIDKNTKDYFIRLTHFYHQFQAIGNNYNQTVVALKKNFGEKRGLQMLYRLEKATFELVVVSKQIIALTREYEEKWLRR